MRAAILTALLVLSFGATARAADIWHEGWRPMRAVNLGGQVFWSWPGSSSATGNYVYNPSIPSLEYRTPRHHLRLQLVSSAGGLHVFTRGGNIPDRVQVRD